MDIKPHLIDVLLYDGVNLLDVSGPVQAFSEAYREADLESPSAPRTSRCRAYGIRYVTPPTANTRATDTDLPHNRLRVRASCGLTLLADAELSLQSQASDLLIPGGSGVDALLANEPLRHIIASWPDHSAQARLLSVCSGALLLAEAGVLNGCIATTHWSREVEVLQRYPQVQWQLDRIMTSSNRVYTSAGVTTGMDLALDIIRRDCGTQSALAVARELVVYLTRAGGQNQFASLIEWQLHDDESLARLVSSIVEQPAKQWNLALMADQLDMTPRTLTRRFTATFNCSPVRFLEQLRVRLAGDMLSTGMPLAKVATRAGFGDVQTLRRAFKRQMDTTPGEYVSRFSV